MRQDTMNGDDGTFGHETIADRPNRPDTTFETAEILIMKARRMRAEVIANGLSRLGGAVLHPLRRWASAKPADVQPRIAGGRHHPA